MYTIFSEHFSQPYVTEILNESCTRAQLVDNTLLCTNKCLKSAMAAFVNKTIMQHPNKLENWLLRHATTQISLGTVKSG